MGGQLECVICLEKAEKPIRLPCTCKSILCLGCFRKFMDEYSNCLVCREKIVQRLRRLCAGRDYECLVLDTSKLETSSEPPSSPERKVRIQAPEPGELQRELERLNAQFERERQEEEKASLALLAELTSGGDPDIVALKRLKEDEELAKHIQETEAQTVERQVSKPPLPRSANQKRENMIKILLQGGTSACATIKPASEPDCFIGVQLVDLGTGDDGAVDKPESTHETDGPFVPRIESSTSSPFSDNAVTSNAEASDRVDGSCSQSTNTSIPTNEVQDLSCDGAENRTNNKPMFLKRSDTHSSSKIKRGSQNQSKVNPTATWTCSVCTFAETSISWLKCEMCGASKHQPTRSCSQSTIV